MNEYCDVSTIAQWFINRAIYDVDNNQADEYITPLKLQKMLYYAQGCYGVMKGKRLFQAKIYNWAHGPVVESIYHAYKDYGASPISTYQDIAIDGETVGILEEVYSVFGKYSGWALRNMTHDESPWKSTKPNEEITFDSIIQYFREHIVVD